MFSTVQDLLISSSPACIQEQMLEAGLRAK